ncbi:MAG: prolyl oligopeptidase family serine peptidase, partial [Verrucomicrobiota bacterium]
GGYGTFSLLAREPKLFAAGIPVAGGGSPATVKRFKKVPVWVFHGDADDVVDVEQSRRMVEALEKERGNVKYTEIEGGTHGIGWQVYNDPKLHEWLFEQTRS